VTEDLATLLRRTASLPSGVFHVRVHGGPDDGAGLTIDGSQPGKLLVGTSSSCHLVLRHDREISRRHLALELAGRRLRLTDLGSTNGTRVGEVEVTEALLRGGETITLGSTTLAVAHDPGGKNPEVPFAAAFGRLIGESREMRRLYPLCEKLARSDVSVLIEGETGTGKEVLAEALHEQGPRAARPFIVFDCTAVSPNLIESELFGHERGAFTGAVGQRRGVFEQADGGTLLIDEIGDLDIALQSKLLRAIERREIRRVGGERAIAVDVRVLSATRRDLDREVQEGRFRDDLYHRLAVARIELPPLRERQGDVAVLARHFWKQLRGPGVAPGEWLGRLALQSWPGHVRELCNAVSRAIALGEDALSTTPSRRPPPLATSGVLEATVDADLPWPEARARVLEELEKRYIEKVLAAHGGSVTRAAEASGIARRHFQRIVARNKGE